MRVYWWCWRQLVLLGWFALLSHLDYLLFWPNMRPYLIVEGLIALSGIPLGLLLPSQWTWPPPTRPAHDTGPPHAPTGH